MFTIGFRSLTSHSPNVTRKVKEDEDWSGMVESSLGTRESTHSEYSCSMKPMRERTRTTVDLVDMSDGRSSKEIPQEIVSPGLPSARLQQSSDEEWARMVETVIACRRGPSKASLQEPLLHLQPGEMHQGPQDGTLTIKEFQGANKPGVSHDLRQSRASDWERFVDDVLARQGTFR